MFDKPQQPGGPPPPPPPIPPGTMPEAPAFGAEEKPEADTELVGHPILDKPTAVESGRLDPVAKEPTSLPKPPVMPPPPPPPGTTIQGPSLSPARSHKMRWVILLIVVVAFLAVLGVWIYILNRPPSVSDSAVPKSDDTAATESEASSTSDVDKDGLLDTKERELGTNVNDPDSDKDGLTDKEEVMLWKTDPLISDTDKDGFLDGQEVDNGYNPAGPGRLYNVNDINL